MSRIQLLLLLLLFAFFVSPIDGAAQVNLPLRVNRVTGELFEPYNAVRYRAWLDDQRRDGQIARTKKLLDFRGREAAYATDACGLGCELHEGIQVRGIAGTYMSAAVYKARLDGDALTVQLRFFNDGAVPARLTMNPYDPSGSFFVQVGDDRLRILTDDDGELESKDAVDEILDPGEIESWWARFSAPRDASTFDLHIPGVTFRDVPLETD